MIYLCAFIYFLMAFSYRRLFFKEMNGYYYRDINEQVYEFEMMFLSCLVFPLHLAVTLFKLVIKELFQ